ncbi:MAG: cupredoxin domain-containing protein [Actinomycetota bacterium]
MRRLVRRLAPALLSLWLVTGWTMPAGAQSAPDETQCEAECAEPTTDSATATPEATPSPSPTSPPTSAATPTPTPTSSEADTSEVEAPPSPTRVPAGRVQAAGSAAVSMVDNAFQPGTIAVQPGTTVTWINNGKVIHTATGDGGGFDSGVLGAGASFSFTFSEPGRYPYYCQIHGAAGGVGMAGAVVVQGAPGDSASTPGSAGSESAPEVSGAPATVVAGGLPNTGREAGLWALVGALLIVAGTILVRGRPGVRAPKEGPEN